MRRRISLRLDKRMGKRMGNDRSREGSRWAALAWWLLMAGLLALGVGTDPIAWAAPHQRPAGQTVPTATPTFTPDPPADRRPRTDDGGLPTATPAPSKSAQSTAVPASTITPGLQPSPAPTAILAASPTPPQPGPSAVRQMPPSSSAALAPPALAVQPGRAVRLPAPKICASPGTPSAEIRLSPVLKENTPLSLAWLAALGCGTVLLGFGLLLLFRSGVW
jgi:hypothetical protein